MEKIQALKCAICRNQSTCFFSEKEKTIEKLGTNRVSQTYKKRHILFSEGHPSHGVYVVCQGSVKLYKSDDKGHRLTMHIAGPVEIVGSRAMLANENYAVSAVTMEDSRLTYIDKATFMAYLTANKDLMLNMLWYLSRKVRDLENKSRDMVMKSVRQRVASVLLSFQDTSGKNRRGKPGVISTYSKIDLADMAGVAHETMVRILKEMERKGVISLKGRQISITDLEALTHQSEEAD